jgi:hypothetical protein
MSQFTSVKDWVKPTTGIKFETTKELIWEFSHVGSGVLLTIPSGFEFDVSIPKLLRWWLSPYDPQFLPAACLHDWMLKQGWNRLASAAEFNRALKACGVKSPKRLLMFLGVALYKWDR